jgi:diguanylate cyclase (GGDEF)-like protein
MHAASMKCAVKQSAFRRLAVFFLVPVGYFAGAKFGVQFTVMPEGIAILWLPNSVLLAALILRGGRGMLPLGLLVICAEVLADVPTFSMVESVLFGITNVAEAVFAYVLLMRSGFSPRFETLADLPRFVLAGPVAGALLASALGATVYTHFRGEEVGYLQFLRIWWFGDAMGLLVFTPLILSFALGAPGLLQLIRKTRPMDWARAGLVIASLVLFVVSRDGVLWGMPFRPMLMLPFAILVAAQFQLRMVTTTTMLMALAVVVSTTRGYDPFGPIPPREAVMQAQEFVLVLCVVSLGLAALLSQLRARHAEIQSANRRLHDMNRLLEARVRERTASLDKLNADLQRLAMADPLTGLFNRRVFFDRAYQEFDRCRRHHGSLAVLMVDIDHFKRINDQHGHQAGDRVLQQVAKTLGDAMRSEDTLTRYGGEEFTVLAPDTDLANALTLATRVQQELSRQPISIDADPLFVTVSIGVASLAKGDKAVEDVLKRADDALYAAKQAGRNRVMTHDPRHRAVDGGKW